MNTHQEKNHEYLFLCHREDTCYSKELCVPRGYYAKVKLFSDNNKDYCIVPQEGVSDCPCGPRKQWFDHRTVECVTSDPVTGECTSTFRPWVMAAGRPDNYLELDSGIYRFCVLDCDYEPIVPDEDDILMRVSYCRDNRVSVYDPQQGNC